MPDDAVSVESLVPITGRRLALPAGPIFHLQRAAEAQHEIGAFRAWAGYKDLGCAAATDGLVLFQHVLSFGPSEVSGRTGVHCHLAHAHIVIPVSGRGVFSYDGVITEAVPGTVIVQHGGTVHDQFAYSYAAASAEANRATPLSLDPAPPDAPPQSFSFFELFVPPTVADVEIVPPGEVTADDQAAAWDHPYHPPGARFAMQAAEDPAAVWRPLADASDLQVRDADTWAPSNRLVATYLMRAATAGPAAGAPIGLSLPGETGGVEIFLVVAGSVGLQGPDEAPVRLEAGDCLTCSAGLAGTPFAPSEDLRLLRIYISARAERLRERTPQEIARLEALGPAIIRRREVRPPGDTRPVNVLHQAGEG